MENFRSASVRIAGLCFELCGSVPILDEFVCHSKEKGDGQICCIQKPLYDGSERLVSDNNGITVFERNDSSWLYRLSDMPDEFQVSLSADYKTVSLYVKSPENKEFEYAQRTLLRMALESIMVNTSRISLHSACVETNGEAVAFTGASGMGKSTRAAAWVNAAKAQLISGDRPVIRIASDGVSACGVPWDGKEQIFRNVEKPLKAILEVRRSDSDYLRKLTPEQAQKVIMKQVFIPMWDTNAAFVAIMNIRKLAKSVPVYRVFCGPDEKNAENIRRILFENPDEILEESVEMKIREGFVLRNIADEYIVMPTGGNIAKFDGAVALNEVSAFIFEKLANPMSKEDLVEALVNEYEVDSETAAKDVDSLISKFEEWEIIE